MPKAIKETEPKDTQRSMVVLIIEIVALAAFIIIYLFLVSRSWAADCIKDADGMINCRVRTTVLEVITLEEKTITGMAAAGVGNNCEGADCKYRVELYDNQGVPHPVEEQYTADNVVKEKVVKLLNQFAIDPNKKEITLHPPTNWTFLLLPAILIVAFIIYRLSLAKPK